MKKFAVKCSAINPNEYTGKEVTSQVRLLGSTGHIGQRQRKQNTPVPVACFVPLGFR